MKKIMPFITFFAKAVIVVFLICALLYVFLSFGLASPAPEVSEFTLSVGNFGKNPVWLIDSYDSTMDDLYAQYNENDLESRVFVAVAMYREALKKIALSEQYSFRCLGTISFNAVGLGGDVVNTQIKSVERIGAPTLSPNHPSRTYYQNIVTAANINAEGVAKTIMESAITKGLREFSDGYNISSEMSSNRIYIDESGGGASWGGNYTTQTLRDYNKNGRRYNDESELREISNLIIDEYSVLAESVVIERHVETDSEGQEETYYTVSFGLDCSDPTSEGSAVYYEAESIRKQVGESLLKRLAYTEASLQLKIYDSGYLTEWSMTDTWEATFKVLFDIEGGASMRQQQTLSYHPDDCVVNDFTAKKAS